MISRAVKPARHHWWPTVLSNFWADHNGQVSILRPSGEVVKGSPGAFCAIRDAHNIRLGEPLDLTFEPVFDRADSSIRQVSDWLLQVDAGSSIIGDDYGRRINIETATPDQLGLLSAVVASLIARSPSTRNSIRCMIEAIDFDDEACVSEATKALIAANQQRLYEAYFRRISTGGRWGLFKSTTREFITGDGFFHNFPSSADVLHSGLKVVCPILPTVAVVYMLPNSHPVEPNMVAMTLTADEVGIINDVTQIYAASTILFRSQKPEVERGFNAGRHQQLIYHGHDWIDYLLDWFSQARVQHQTGGLMPPVDFPYTSMLEGNRQMAAFMARR